MTSARDNASGIIIAILFLLLTHSLSVAVMKHAIAVHLIGDMHRNAKDSDKRDRWTEIWKLITANGCEQRTPNTCNGCAMHFTDIINSFACLICRPSGVAVGSPLTRMCIHDMALGLSVFFFKCTTHNRKHGCYSISTCVSEHLCSYQMTPNQTKHIF